jgi:uncharacterized protein (TIGR00730 family)
MAHIRNICVYCGSSNGTDPGFPAAAARLGALMAGQGIGLVYGGGSAGLMGALATAVHQHGGQVTGIIPDFLVARERMFVHATEMIVTRDMHERKRLMFERADAFVALPGGIGTLEELVEQLTWAQLGQHRKPILIANINGFWDGFVELFAHMSRFGFIHSSAMVDFEVVDKVEEILPTLLAAAARIPEEAEAGEPETVKRL